MSSTDTTPERQVRKITRAQVSAARIRVDTDRRLKRETPEWIVQLANTSTKP